MIDSINDPILKASYIRQIQQKISQPSTNNPLANPKGPTISNFDENVIRLFSPKQRKVTITDLQKEINQVKEEIRELKHTTQMIQSRLKDKSSKKAKKKLSTQNNHDNFKSLDDSESEQPIITEDHADHQLASILHPNLIQQQETLIIKEIRIQKWYMEVNIRISSCFHLRVNVLIDTGVNLNCMREAFVPTKYFEKTAETLYGANKQQLSIQYKLTNAKVCNGGVCYNTSFLMVKNLSQNVILGLPFIHLISPFRVTSEGLII
ncbi:hypothetical protein LWI28_004979 [Acer negundo]|uniref:Retropepsins domain-containing protein n=1 Tax=Acer negundo TaxID=4023 RepID=A0AAD5JIJ8_ACENE|nr:hypothetical protein LWI28_004979 [Acer negundo]